MTSMQNITVQDVLDIAKKLEKNLVTTGDRHKVIAAMITITEYEQGKGERVISRAIVPCVEVHL